jgi:hypothetical protein
MKNMITHNTIAGLLFAASFATAAPFEIEGPIKEVKKVATKAPYTFDEKPVVSLTIVGHRFGKDFEYQYMIVEGTTELAGISFADLKPGKYVRIKGRAEPPGMVGKPINEIRASRYGLCNFALHVDTVATPKNLTATITRVDSFGADDIVVTVQEKKDAPEFKYLVVNGKTTIKNGAFADLKVSAKIAISEASINVPVAADKDHGKLHGSDLFANTVTVLKSPSL